MPQPPLIGEDGGWTRVGRGKGHKPGLVHNNVPSLIRDMTTEKIQNDFEVKLKVWRKSSCRQRLVHFLDSRKPDEGWKIENAICLASNSFSRDNFQNRQRALMQCAACLDIVQYLQSIQDTAIRMYAQDPMYTDVDRVWLRTIGVEPLSLSLDSKNVHGLSPAKDLLHADSLVFELFMDVKTEAAVDLFASDAKLYIGAACDNCLARSNAGGPDLTPGKTKEYSAAGHGPNNVGKFSGEPIGRADAAKCFAASRRKLDFPTFDEDPTVFEGLKIFWKEPTDGG